MEGRAELGVLAMGLMVQGIYSERRQRGHGGQGITIPLPHKQQTDKNTHAPVKKKSYHSY